MPDYSKGCIYMIKKQNDFNNDNVYIGSTCNLIRRKHKHKSRCNNENDINYNLKLYQYIRQNRGWNSWCMTKIIDYPCNSKSELNTMERSYIDDYKSKLNCIIPMRTLKEWRDDNKEKLVQYVKQYRNDNKDKIVEKQKQYHNDNKDKILENKKKYYDNNKDKILEKVICDNCGCKISKNNLASHKRTQKCINLNSK